MQNQANEKLKKIARGITWAVFLVVAFLFLLAITTPCFLRARPKANFTACVQQLKNISNGLQQEISEKGSLKGIKSEDDVCHHILPGFEKPVGCVGMVKKQIDEICLKDSYSIKILDGFRYEIRAQSNEKSQCKICVTESAVRPKMYDPAGECQKLTCVH